MSARRRLTASTRVALAVVMVLAVGVSAVSAVAYTGVTNRVADDLDAALVREVEAYTATVAPRGAAEDRTLEDASRSYLEARVEQQTGLSPVLLVQFADGRVLSNSSIELEKAAGNASLLATDTATPGFTELSFEGVRYRAATTLVVNESGTTVAVFQAAASTSELDTVARQLLISLAIASTSVVLVGALFSLRVARKTLSPLRDIARIASHVTQTSLGERVDHVGPDDEITALAQSLDAMLDRIEIAFGEQRRFVGDASHELRTPVAIIRGNLDIARASWASDGEQEEAMRVIDDEVNRMQRLLEDMLSLARGSSSLRRPFQPLDIGLVLQDAAARAHNLGEREWSLSCATDPWALGDADLLEQAIGNLLRNAIEHTTEGQRIDLECSGGDGGVVIRIHDTGPGIPEKDLPNIFDRFYRARGVRSTGAHGSGLGLAIVRQIVWMHSGTVDAANAADGGAVFTVRLPAIEPPDDTL